MNDSYAMVIALDEAKNADSEGCLPIGASLFIDGKFVGSNGNSQIKQFNYFNHAENLLIQMYATEIKQAYRNGSPIELFTTMEPCLMCLGTSVQNRLTRIVYACPDPIAGSTHIAPPTEWYKGKWPKMERGPFARESYGIFMRYIEEHPEEWKNLIPIYRKFGEKLL